MANWLGHTNQKLYQARLLLDESSRASGPDALSGALREGGVYLLRDAYISYLNELAELAGVKTTVTSLQQAMDVTGLVIGEMTELKQLEDDPYSWLTEFLRGAEGQNMPAAPAGAVEVTPAGLIPLTNQSQESTPLEWWQSLSDLIDSQRLHRRES